MTLDQLLVPGGESTRAGQHHLGEPGVLQVKAAYTTKCDWAGVIDGPNDRLCPSDDNHRHSRPLGTNHPQDHILPARGMKSSASIAAHFLELNRLWGRVYCYILVSILVSVLLGCSVLVFDHISGNVYHGGRNANPVKSCSPDELFSLVCHSIL